MDMVDQNVIGPAQEIADPEERRFLNSVATTLQLPRATIERIRGAANKLLDESPDFRRLLVSLRPRPVSHPSQGQSRFSSE